MPYLLEIKNLHVKAGEQEIIKGLNLVVKPGEVHALMGPNGSGKSTLSAVLMGHPLYQVTTGSLRYLGKNIIKLTPEKRAAAGLFLAFQYPQSIPGLSVEEFLRAAYNAQAEVKKDKKINVLEFRHILEQEMAKLKFKIEFLSRSVNDGFSGGEKKRLEVLQLAVLKPKLAILDEIDSGLDVDALKLVARGVKRLVNLKMGVIIITHHQRILCYLKPNRVHVMVAGKIVESGGYDLVKKVENDGYEKFNLKLKNKKLK
jgi:Fe-S cluster assembly ATP-binding protein